jgi:hypothetical protein
MAEFPDEPRSNADFLEFGSDQALRNARELTLNLIETTGCSVGKLNAEEEINAKGDTTPFYRDGQGHEDSQSKHICSL